MGARDPVTLTWTPTMSSASKRLQSLVRDEAEPEERDRFDEEVVSVEHDFLKLCGDEVADVPETGRRAPRWRLHLTRPVARVSHA